MATDPRIIVQALVERGLTPAQAFGVAGNMQIESDGFQTDVNEYAPLVPGSRGGYGLNQWTGPRRVQFEQFASDRGVSPSDLDTQIDFTMWELANTERRAGEALRQAQTPEEAARIYSQKFLRPGIPHLDRRVQAARELAGMGGEMPMQAPAPQQSAPQNVFAQQQTPQTQQNPFAAPQPPQINQLAYNFRMT